MIIGHVIIDSTDIISKNDKMIAPVAEHWRKMNKIIGKQPCIVGPRAFHHCYVKFCYRNIAVLTEQMNPNSFLKYIKSCNPNQDIYVLGGAETYKAMLPFMDSITMLRTMEHNFEGNGVSFPEYKDHFKMASVSAWYVCSGTMVREECWVPIGT